MSFPLEVSDAANSRTLVAAASPDAAVAYQKFCTCDSSDPLFSYQGYDETWVCHDLACNDGSIVDGVEYVYFGIIEESFCGCSCCKRDFFRGRGAVQNCVDGLLTITPYTAVGATDCAGLRLGCDGKSLDIKRVTGRCVDSDPCSTQPALDGQSIRTAWTQAASSSSCTSSTVCIAVQTRECGVWGAPAVKCAGLCFS